MTETQNKMAEQFSHSWNCAAGVVTSGFRLAALTIKLAAESVACAAGWLDEAIADERAGSAVQASATDGNAVRGKAAQTTETNPA
jgi:hypothetical protein